MIFLQGCGAKAPDFVVKPGISSDAFVEKLGKPVDVLQSGDEETLIYIQSGEEMWATFRDDQLIFFGPARD